MVQNGWSGLVNRPGDGVDNRWTWMGIHRTKADSGQTSASKDQSGKTPASKDQSGKTPAAGDRSGKTPAAGDRSGETPASKDQSGKTLVLGVPSVLNTLNPLLADSKNEWRVLQLLCSPLFDLDPVTLQEVPILAKSWDLSGWTDSDGTEFMKVTFHLRAGVFWQDGAPFAAQDVKYTIDLLRKSQDANFEDIISRIDDVIAPDKETVEIYLKDKGYRCLYELAWLTFLPEHIWKNVTDTVNCKPWLETNPLKENLTGLVGQGPFRLEKSGIVDGNLQNGLTLVWDPAYDQSVVAKAIRDRK